jgi:hypothetical protein
MLPNCYKLHPFCARICTHIIFCVSTSSTWPLFLLLRSSLQHRFVMIRQYMFSSIPLHNSTSVLLILNSLNGSRRNSISFKKRREQKTQGFRSGLGGGEYCHNFDDPGSRVGQKEVFKKSSITFPICIAYTYY